MGKAAAVVERIEAATGQSSPGTANSLAGTLVELSGASTLLQSTLEREIFFIARFN